jgi:tight adherence protein C
MDMNAMQGVAQSGANLQSMILAAVFVTTVLIVVGASYWFFGATSPVKRRLQEIADPEGRKTHELRREGAFTVRWVEPVAKVITPEEDWRRSRIKTRLVQAGFRSHQAMSFFLAAKVVMAFVLPVLIVLPLYLAGYFGQQPGLGVGLVTLAGLIGFFGPDIYVLHRHQERRQIITESFPDALDMLVVCVEAGLSLDAAIQRVAREMIDSHQEIAEELQLVNLELRAGKSREDALHGLYDRTGVEDIKSLASILIQAERFGTSIASSLREHADEMRLMRIQKAREKAAKLPVKLIFPIIFFIFPALFLVILGPAAIRIYTGLIGTLNP